MASWSEIFVKRPNVVKINVFVSYFLMVRLIAILIVS